MNLGQAFSFPFQDPDWLKKIGVMALISLIPIIGQIILLGWGLEITRRVIQGSPVILPDIDMGNQLGEGFKGFIASFAYSLPIILMSIPSSILPYMTEDSSLQNSEGVIMAFTLCCSGLILLYALLLAFVLPAALGNLAAKGNLGAAFDFKTILGLVRAAPVAYLLVVVGTLAASFISSLGIIACFIGIFVTSVYSLAVMTNLYGQAYNEATKNSSQVYTPGM